MQLLSIIIPVYNEEKSIKPLYTQIKKVLKSELKKYGHEIIFINDGSTDRSAEFIKSLHRADSQVKLASFRRNVGKASALNQGFRMAKGKIIVTMDGDLQDGPENIPALIRKLDRGFDLVIGWKKKRFDPPEKIIPSKTFNFIVGKFSKIPLHDFNSGLKVMRAEVAAQLYLFGEMHRFIPVLAHQRGYKVTEIPVHHHPRRFGVSKYGWSRLMSGLFDFVTIMFIGSYSQRPFHFFGLFGLIALFLGTIFGTYLSVLHFQGESIGQRPLLILSVLLIVTGLQTLLFGLIAEILLRKSPENENPPIVEIIN